MKTYIFSIFKMLASLIEGLAITMAHWIINPSINRLFYNRHLQTKLEDLNKEKS